MLKVNNILGAFWDNGLTLVLDDPLGDSCSLDQARDCGRTGCISKITFAICLQKERKIITSNKPRRSQTILNV
jgi:hypothetical protein